jgi:acyl carrier protein
MKNLRETVLAILSAELAEVGQPLNVHVPIRELGADSLDAISLQMEIEAALHIKFSVEEELNEGMTAMEIYNRVAAKVGAA